MKQLKIILLTLVAALAIIACKNEQGNTKTEQTETEKTSSVDNPIQEEQKIVFEKTGLTILDWT